MPYGKADLLANYASKSDLETVLSQGKSLNSLLTNGYNLIQFSEKDVAITFSSNLERRCYVVEIEIIKKCKCWAQSKRFELRELQNFAVF
jgi:hypothetical protein